MSKFDLQMGSDRLSNVFVIIYLDLVACSMQSILKLVQSSYQVIKFILNAQKVSINKYLKN